MNIYKFTHIESQRVYIGQTIQDPNRRRLEHIADSRSAKQTHKFCNALRKYGVDAFRFEVIASATSLENLNILEVYFIAEYNSIQNGFNTRNGGDNRLHNNESIEKMRVAQRAAHARRKALGTDTWTRKDGGAMLGKSHPKKGSSGNWTMSHEAKEKISKARFLSNGVRGKSWKIVNGARVYYTKESI